MSKAATLAGRGDVILAVSSRKRVHEQVSRVAKDLKHLFTVAWDGNEALRQCVELQPKVVVLDGGDAFCRSADVLRVLKQEKDLLSLTVIYLKRVGEEEPENVPHEFGSFVAVDYLTYPDEQARLDDLIRQRVERGPNRMVIDVTRLRFDTIKSGRRSGTPRLSFSDAYKLQEPKESPSEANAKWSLGKPEDDEDMLDVPYTFRSREFEDEKQDLETGRQHYMHRCGELKIQPINQFVSLLMMRTQLVSLKHFGILDEGADAVGAALGAPNRCIRELDLAENSIGERGMIAFFEKTFPRNVLLRSLTLEGNKLGTSTGVCMAHVLGATRDLSSIQRHDERSKRRVLGSTGDLYPTGQQTSCMLTSLCLYRCQIGTAGVAAIAMSLLQNDRLTELDLRENVIGAEGGKALAQIIYRDADYDPLDEEIIRRKLSSHHISIPRGVHNTALTDLKLGSNHLGWVGATAIAEALVKVTRDPANGNPYLHELDLSWNGVGSEGAMSFGIRFAQMTTIRDLDLQHNRIGREGGIVISHGLRGNTGLTSLNLNTNPMGSTAVACILSALQVNEDVRECSLQATEVTADATAEELAGENAALLVGDLAGGALSKDVSGGGFDGNPVRFNPEKPTGRYQLDMQKTWEWWVGERLVELSKDTSKKEMIENVRVNGQERKAPLRLPLPRDGVISFRYTRFEKPLFEMHFMLNLGRTGDRSHYDKLKHRLLLVGSELWMNTKLNGSNIRIDPLEWKPPAQGVFELDYIMLQPPRDLTAPEGKYKLDLTLPWERWIAQMLRDRALKEPAETWGGPKLNGRKFDFGPQWHGAKFGLPTTGTLEFEYIKTTVEPQHEVKYILDLSHMWCRWAALRLAERSIQRPGESIRNLMRDGQEFEPHNMRNTSLPRDGVLELDYIVRGNGFVNNGDYTFMLDDPSDVMTLRSVFASELSWDFVRLDGEPFLAMPMPTVSFHERQSAQRLLKLFPEEGKVEMILAELRQKKTAMDDIDYNTITKGIRNAKSDPEKVSLLRQQCNSGYFTAKQGIGFFTLVAFKQWSTILTLLLPRVLEFHRFMEYLIQLPTSEAEASVSVSELVGRINAEEVVDMPLPAR